ncbi:MAG: isoleucine--tRNA ligase [Candidatus Micrarchaeota archaeon]
MVDLKEIEENVLAYWKSHSIYKKANKRVQGGEPFYFCDGPPYATGQIHPGTAWNKTLKDSIVRYYRAKGCRVRDRPGYDTHGLPIEVQVEKELAITDKKEIEKMGLETFILKCKEYASKYIGIISEQFMRCGIWLDWDNPYVTYENYYINSSWKTIKAAEEKGLLIEGNYVVPYSPASQTSLANYELEYKEKEDPSIYVKFKVKGKDNEYLIIWTTTPWTLVANRAVMVHPTFTYSRIQVDDEIWVIAKERIEHVMGFFPDKSYSALGDCSGKKLEGTQYEHPLQAKLAKDFDRKVILSDEHVTLEDGSGLVHTAPGHGPEDFIVCKRYGIEPFCPVDTTGRYTEDAGEYNGLEVLEANPKVISDLKSIGALVHQSKIVHRYPHDWRKKTPLIYIATHQWFFSISKLKERMLHEVDNSINFHPDFAKTRFRDFVSSAPDWCISRQRFWGTPLPIWICTNKECGARKVVADSSELPNPSIELHRPFIDKVEFECEKCKSTMKRVPDVLDVWFDSGNSIWAQLAQGEAQNWTSKDGTLQADFVVEGKDQTRGYFYSLLGCGAVLNNETPYKNLTMHGFFVDEKGEKMSKSVGNFVPLEEILEKYGADSFRLWGLSSTIWDDLKFSYAQLDEAKRSIDIMLNLGVWMQRFYVHPKTRVEDKNLEMEDRWLLSRTQTVIEKATNSFETFEPFWGIVALRHFLVEDVSRFYIKRLKQRIAEGKNVDAGMQTLYDCLLQSIQMLAPYCPFVSEHLYLMIFKEHVGEESVSFLLWPKASSKYKDALLEQQMEYLRSIINCSFNARMKGNLKLRWPAKEMLIDSDSTEVKNSVGAASDFLKAMANVLEVRFAKPDSSFEVSIKQSKIGQKFKQDSAHVSTALKAMNPQKIMDGLKNRPFMLEGKYDITPDLVEITETCPDYAVAQFGEGAVYISTKADEAIYALGMEREILRRIQSMRKGLELTNSDEILASVSGDSKLAGIAQGSSDICRAANCKKISEKLAKADLEKEWEIDGKSITVSIKKL